MIDSKGCGAAWELGGRGEGLAGSVLLEPVCRTLEARLMDTDLEALATALYVTVDDLLKDHPEVLPPRPQVGITAVTSDAEIITLAVVQALLGYTSKTRWIRRLRSDTDLRAMFSRVPGQSGYNKRVHSLTATMTWVCAALRRGSRVHDDTVWLVDSTPIECARCRPTVMRSALAGWAEYG